MRILYVITGLQLGGAEKQLLLVAGALKRMGHTIHIVSMKSGGALKHDFEQINIAVTELDITSILNFYKAGVRLKSLIDSFQPDVVHSHMVHANLFSRLARLFFPMHRLICTAHNINEGGKGLMLMYRLTDRLADFSTNVSKEALEHFLKIKAFNVGRCMYLPNAIDTDLFVVDHSHDRTLRTELGLIEEDFIFLAVGRLHPQKDYPTLLSAFSKIYQYYPKIKLLIAGEGELLQDLLQLTEKLGINGQVKFLGRRNDIEKLMNLCDCFVLSSIYEGFGLVIAEAMSTGTFVISTDSGGVKEVMGGVGKLVPIQAVDQFADEMSNIVKFRSPISEQARQHIVENFALHHICRMWLDLYTGKAR